MSNCLFCNVELTSANSAKEHIIPNAIGGRLKSSTLDCLKCNNECGAACDSALADSLNPLANLLGIERENGEPPPIVGTMGGKGVRLDADGKPEFTKPEHEVKKDGSTVQISIKARDLREARKMLEGFARKYPINVADVIKGSTLRQEYLPDMVKFNFSAGGPDTLRSVTKTAYLFLRHKRPALPLDREQELVEFIKGIRDYKSAYFLPGDRVVAPAPGQVLHAIVIKSYPAERLLVAFVEYFSVFTFVILLSENCDEDVFEHYVFDPVERREMSSVRFTFPNLDRKSLSELFEKLPSLAAPIQQRLAEFLTIATGRRRKAALDEKLADEGQAGAGCPLLYGEPDAATPEPSEANRAKLISGLTAMIENLPKHPWPTVFGHCRSCGRITQVVGDHSVCKGCESLPETA